MPQLKPRSSHKLCSAYIQRYLEKEERALARDFFNVPPAHQERWAEWFDATRSAVGNDLAWRGKEAVTYQHFIISPDPRDEVDLETLQTIVAEWYAENFLSEGGIGPYPAAVVYHDDNENQIAHAHIIVNNTIPGTRGARLQVSNARNKAMGDSLQRIAFTYGLSYFPCFDRELTADELSGRTMPDVRIGGPKSFAPLAGVHRAKRLTRAESAMLSRNVIPWKEKLRNAIDVAVGRSLTEAEMDETLLAMGVGRERRGDADDLFYMVGRPTLRARGRTLGDDYSRESLALRLADMRLDWDSADSSGVRLRQKAENVMGDHDTLWWFYVNSEGVSEELLETGVEAREVAEMERVNNLEHIVSPADYEGALRKLRVERDRIAKAGMRWDVRELDERISALARARDVAETIGAFEGVADPAGPTRHHTHADIDRELRAELEATDEADVESRMAISKKINDNREKWARSRERAKRKVASRARDAATSRGREDAPGKSRDVSRSRR